MGREKISADQLREKLNRAYDEMEALDKEIDMLILKRNKIKYDIETGVSILLMLDK